MKQVKIKISELLQLEIDLLGYTNNGRVIVSGLLNEKLNIKVKYHLGKLADKVLTEKKYFDDIRQNLLEKYGVLTSSGTYEIKQLDGDGKVTEEFSNFSKEIQPLLEEEIDMEFPEIDLDDLDFETEHNYFKVLQLVIK